MVNKENVCWEWTGSILSSGYGRMTINGVTFRAHRLSAMIHFGEFDNSLLVCHVCDNKICVRPDHLFLGTHQDNMRDMSNKNRSFWKNKTHCIHGHEYTDKNTWYQNGYRYCRECKLNRQKQYDRKKVKDE